MRQANPIKSRLPAIFTDLFLVSFLPLWLRVLRSLAGAQAEGHAKGLAEGLAEGLAKGHVKGLTEGRAKGLVEGESKGHNDAIAILQGMNLSPKQISEFKAKLAALSK